MHNKFHTAEILFFAGLFLVFVCLALYPDLTARIIAQGGNVTRVDVSTGAANTYWYGAYGNVSLIYPNYQSFFGGAERIVNFNVGRAKCLGSELYASSLDIIDWGLVEPANPEDLDNYLSITPSSPLSGSKVFTSKQEFNVDGMEMLLWSASLASGKMGILKQGVDIIFVKKMQDSICFDGKACNYEMLLPVRSGFLQYNFFLDPVDAAVCNEPPIFTEVRAIPPTRQDDSSIIIARWTDPNNDEVIVSSTVEGIVTYLSPTHAQINWTPSHHDSGYKNITIYLKDSYGNTANQTIEVFIENQNDPPQIIQAEDVYAYLHVPYNQTIVAYDPDYFDSILDEGPVEFSTDPYMSWFRIIPYFNSSDRLFYGIIDFIPYDSQKGEHEISIIATDGQDSGRKNITVNIGYCGDKDESGSSICDSMHETCENCPVDCGICSSDELKHMAIDISRAACNGSRQIHIYDLAERGTCEFQGAIINGHEMCGPVGSVAVESYVLRALVWEHDGDYVSDDAGRIDFIGRINESYRFMAKKKGYYDAYTAVGKSFCSDRFSIPEQEETAAQIPSEEKKPRAEQPEEVRVVQDDSTSVKDMIFFYALVALSAMMLLAVVHHAYTAAHRQKIRKIWRKVLDFLGF